MIGQQCSSCMSQEGARLEQALRVPTPGTPQHPRTHTPPHPHPRTPPHTPAPQLESPCIPKGTKLRMSAPLGGKAHPKGACGGMGVSRGCQCVGGCGWGSDSTPENLGIPEFAECWEVLDRRGCGCG